MGPRRTPDGVKFGVKRRRPAKDPRKNNWDNPTQQRPLPAARYGVKFGVKRRRPAKDPRKNNWDNPTEQDLPRRKATKFNYIYGTKLPRRKETLLDIERERKRRDQIR